MIVLLPCPFCGSDPRLLEAGEADDEPQNWTVGCYCCAMRPRTGGYRTSAEAIVAWNTRAHQCPACATPREP